MADIYIVLMKTSAINYFILAQYDTPFLFWSFIHCALEWGITYTTPRNDIPM